MAVNQNRLRAAMTSTDPTLTVSVEATIHKALADVVQTIANEHGVQIRAFSADWIDVSTNAKAGHRVTRINLETFSTSW